MGRSVGGGMRRKVRRERGRDRKKDKWDECRDRNRVKGNSWVGDRRK